MRVVVSIELHDSAKNILAFVRSWDEGPAVALGPLDDKQSPMWVAVSYGERTLRLPIRRATWDADYPGWVVEVEYPSLGAPPHILDRVVKSFQADNRWTQIQPPG